MGLEVRRLKEQLSVKADVVWSLENRKQQLMLRLLRTRVRVCMCAYVTLCSFVRTYSPLLSLSLSLSLSLCISTLITNFPLF